MQGLSLRTKISWYFQCENVFSQEEEFISKDNQAFFKSLLGGDPIDYQIKYVQGVKNFVSNAVVLFTSNELPQNFIRDNQALLDRFIFINLNNTSGKADDTMQTKLMDGKHEIATWGLTLNVRQHSDIFVRSGVLNASVQREASLLYIFTCFPFLRSVFSLTKNKEDVYFTKPLFASKKLNFFEIEASLCFFTK